MPTKRIDLHNYRDPESRIFSGRPRGTRVRLATCLPQLEKEGYTFEIHVPEDTYSVTSSFFLGMFGDSIRGLGEEAFRTRYRFTGKNIRRVLDEAVREAQKRTSPLDSLI